MIIFSLSFVHNCMFLVNSSSYAEYCKLPSIMPLFPLRIIYLPIVSIFYQLIYCVACLALILLLLTSHYLLCCKLSPLFTNTHPRILPILLYAALLLFVFYSFYRGVVLHLRTTLQLLQ